MILSKGARRELYLLVFILGIAIASPAFGGSAVIGSVAGSTNATIRGQIALPNTTVLSGDSLQVNDGAAVVAIDSTSRMAFGRDTTVSFLRDGSEITVLLSRGNVSMYHPQDAVALRVKVGEVTVVAAKGFKTLGEVAMIGSSIVITAKEGSFRVEGNGSAGEEVKGQTITVPAKAARAARSSPAAPQGALAGGAALQAAAVGAAGVAAVLSGISISRANDARDAANAANSTAASAVTAATSATSAANVAVSSGAANATTINLVGCAIDKVTPNVTVNGTKVSPYTPPAGSTCP